MFIFNLVQYVFVEVWHVAMIGHWPLVIILEVLLQSHGVMWNVQHRVKVVGEHLHNRQRRYKELSRQLGGGGLLVQSVFLHTSMQTHTKPSVSGQLSAISLDSSVL